jgi:hypothetical protein
MTYYSILTMEERYTSERSVDFQRTAERYILKDKIFIQTNFYVLFLNIRIGGKYSTRASSDERDVYCCMYKLLESRGDAVGITTGYGLDDQLVEVRGPVGKIPFSSLRRPDRLGGPRSLLSNGYRDLFPRG